MTIKQLEAELKRLRNFGATDDMLVMGVESKDLPETKAEFFGIRDICVNRSITGHKLVIYFNGVNPYIKS